MLVKWWIWRIYLKYWCLHIILRVFLMCCIPCWLDLCPPLLDILVLSDKLSRRSLLQRCEVFTCFIFHLLLGFFVACLNHLSSMSLAEASDESLLNSNWSIFYVEIGGFSLSLSNSHKYVDKELLAVYGWADLIRKLSASQSVKLAGSLRNQTLAWWFKAWTSH